MFPHTYNVWQTSYLAAFVVSVFKYLLSFHEWNNPERGKLSPDNQLFAFEQKFLSKKTFFQRHVT